MLLGEVADALALHIQHAHHAILHHQRHGHFGMNVRLRRDIARVLRGVYDAHRLPRFRRGARDALAQRNIIELDAFIVTNAKAVAQQLLLGIHQQNAEGVVVDQGSHGGGDLAQQLVEIENRAELLRELRQRTERPVLLMHAPVETRVFNRPRDARCDQAHEAAVLITKGSQTRGLHIDHAHQLAAHHHRHRQLAPHRIQRDQVTRVGAHIFHQHRLAAERGGSHHAFAEPDDHAAHDLFAVADGVANAQALIAFAVKQNREQIVGNYFLNNAGHVRQKLVEIQRLGRDARHFQQEVEQLGAFAERFAGLAWSRHAVGGLSRRGLDDLHAGARADAGSARRHHGLQVFESAHASGSLHADHGTNGTPHQRDISGCGAAGTKAGGRLHEIGTGFFRQPRSRLLSVRHSAERFQESL